MKLEAKQIADIYFGRVGFGNLFVIGHSRLIAFSSEIITSSPENYHNSLLMGILLPGLTSFCPYQAAAPKVHDISKLGGNVFKRSGKSAREMMLAAMKAKYPNTVLGFGKKSKIAKYLYAPKFDQAKKTWEQYKEKVASI